MAVAAFVLSLVTLFGAAGALWWLDRRAEQTREGLLGLRDVQAGQRLLVVEGKLSAIEAAQAYKPKPADKPEDKAKQRPRTMTQWREQAEALPSEVVK